VTAELAKPFNLILEPVQDIVTRFNSAKSSGHFDLTTCIERMQTCLSNFFRQGLNTELLVEVGGVEPPSESALQGASPGADADLHSLTQAPHRQAQGFGSFMIHGAGKAYRTHVPH